MHARLVQRTNECVSIFELFWACSPLEASWLARVHVPWRQSNAECHVVVVVVVAMGQVSMIDGNKQRASARKAGSSAASKQLTIEQQLDLKWVCHSKR